MIKKSFGMVILILLITSAVGMVEGEGLEETDIESELEPTALANSPWPKVRGNRNNTGFSEVDTSHLDGTEKWRFSIGDQSLSSPAIGENGTIYFCSKDIYDEAGNLYAVNPDGTEKWNFSADDSIESSPAIGEDGTIYVGSTGGHLYAINPDGSLKWRFLTSTLFPTVGSPTVGKDGTIYAGTGFDDLYAVHSEHTEGEPGTEKWSIGTDGSIRTSPAIGENGTLYVTNNGGSLHAINPNGTEIWSFSADDMIQTHPAIGEDGTIYVGSGFGESTDDTNVYAVNPNGTEKWSFETGDVVSSSPAIGKDGTLYIGSRDTNLYAIHTEKTEGEPGTEKWSFEVRAGIKSSPVVGGDGTVYFGTINYDFIALHTEVTDGKPGTEKWRFGDGSRTRTSPAIAGDGTIYYTSTNGNLYALGGVPSAPRDLKATPGTEQVELDWEPPLEKGGGEFIGYNIFRGEESDDLGMIGEVDKDKTSYLDENLMGNKTYYYCVTGVSGDGEGEESNNVSATPSVDWTRLDQIGIEPRGETITAGESVEYSAFGYDSNGEMVAVLTENTEWSIEEGAGGDWVGSEYTSEKAGEWSINAEYTRDGEEFTDEVSLTVDPGPVSYIVIESNDDLTVVEGETIDFSAEAYDEFDNLVEDNDTEFNWNKADDDGSFEKEDTGEYEVVASLDGESSETVQVTVEESSFLSNYWWMLVVLAAVAIVIGIILVMKRKASSSPPQQRFEQKQAREPQRKPPSREDEEDMDGP